MGNIAPSSVGIPGTSTTDSKGAILALNNGIGGRIVNGTDAAKKEIPWQISYRTWPDTGAQHICGGSVYNEVKVETFVPHLKYDLKQFAELDYHCCSLLCRWRT